MKKFTVSYRNEFEAEIEAVDINEAVQKFKNGEAKYSVIDDLHNDYIEVYDKDGHKIN